jgi:uncharacterized protein (UPF0276 family)
VKYFDADGGSTRLGLAYSPGAMAFVEAHPGMVDYIEMPFEQLRHAPALAALQTTIPIVLHCASLSIAGFVPPSAETVEAIRGEARRTRTPWLGEHLAFVSADGLDQAPDGQAPPTTLTYTVCPQLSEETLGCVTRNLASVRRNFDVPLILENPPLYFTAPGSTMNLVDYIAEVLARSDTGLLLDLTHFLIGCLNTASDALAEIRRLPLERVVEVHISGLSTQSGVAWDDHAVPAPAEVFELLDSMLARVRPKAVTLEYNWSPHFPHPIWRSHIERVRRRLEQA